MLFNSVSFLVFLPIVFIFYWFVYNRNYKSQNVLLLIASYFFYACWDWRFLFLLVFSTLLDYFTALKIDRSDFKKTRKMWLIISVAVNLGFLGFFKYYNFFIDSFSLFLESLAIKPGVGTLNIILPVGISFYTFHGLSYVFDVYNKKIHSRRNFVDYSLFVSFFPLLVAGPIERATHLLPQVERPRVFSGILAAGGLKQILWGMFKKVVIADSCAELVDTIFESPIEHSGSMLMWGAFLFAVQIYCDFSGYSDIALGVARLLGFELLKNFSFPYFSRDIAEFWRRWHISLSSWFKDYLYIPIGGSRGPVWKKIRNVFVIFLVSGLWHGANWTFLFWGAINALFFLPLLLVRRNRNHLDIVSKGRLIPSFREAVNMLFTFSLTVFAWIFFRSENLHHAFEYISGIVSLSIFEGWQAVNKTLLVLILLFFSVEWIGREGNYAIEKIGIRWSRAFRWSMYSMIIVGIGLFMRTKETAFIYFQF